MPGNDNQTTILITGATGNIGARLLVELLSCGQNIRLLALVRGKSEAEARSRLNANLRLIAPDLVDWGSTRAIEVLCRDITEDDLGLPGTMRDTLVRSVTHIVHAAASTQWHLPLDCARAVNVIGTENVLRLAQQARRHGHLKRFVYLSTAYVCGEREGVIKEVVHTGELRFANTYEQTKWEAEQKVIALQEELPVTIIRPSITVGDSRTGLAVTYNVLYPPLKYILTGKLTALSCPPENRLDLVPVDYVARAVAYLTLHSQFRSGTIFHLTAGLNRSVAIAEVVKRALALIGDERINLPVTYESTVEISANAIGNRNRRAATLMKLYASYLQKERDFDDTNTRSALEISGIRLPDLREYIDTLLKAFIAQEAINDRFTGVPIRVGGGR